MTKTTVEYIDYALLREGKSDLEIEISGIFRRIEYEYRRFSDWENSLPRPQEWKRFSEIQTAFWLDKINKENERHGKILRSISYALAKTRERCPHIERKVYSDGFKRDMERKQCILCKKIITLECAG